MVPLHLKWDMGSAKVSLRDYPLPLVNIRPCNDGRPAWTLDTTFIIAEELHDDDSTMYVPCEIIPAGLGDSDAQPFVVEVYKTISPVKTYTRPHIKIHSERTTEFTWGNSMQPAIQDFMKVMETLSHAQIDPSPRIGFWDKFRLILHWVVKIDFEGPVHLHLKGESVAVNVYTDVQVPTTLTSSMAKALVSPWHGRRIPSSELLFQMSNTRLSKSRQNNY